MLCVTRALIFDLLTEYAMTGRLTICIESLIVSIHYLSAPCHSPRLGNLQSGDQQNGHAIAWSAGRSKSLEEGCVIALYAANPRTIDDYAKSRGVMR